MSKKVKKRVKKDIPKGIAHIKATFNNTLVMISDRNGDAVAWDSAGTVGYKGKIGRAHV